VLEGYVIPSFFPWVSQPPGRECSIARKKNQGEIRTNVPLRPGVSNWVNQTLVALPLLPIVNFTAVSDEVSRKVFPSYGIRRNGVVVWPG
jgi:hypothetical protein